MDLWFTIFILMFSGSVCENISLELNFQWKLLICLVGRNKCTNLHARLLTCLKLFNNWTEVYCFGNKLKIQLIIFATLQGWVAYGWRCDFGHATEAGTWGWCKLKLKLIPPTCEPKCRTTFHPRCMQSDSAILIRKQCEVLLATIGTVCLLCDCSARPEC